MSFIYSGAWLCKTLKTCIKTFKSKRHCIGSQCRSLKAGVIRSCLEVLVIIRAAGQAAVCVVVSLAVLTAAHYNNNIAKMGVSTPGY